VPSIGAGDRYIVTADIKQAVKGHETEILDKLSIRWRECKPHVQCPYPDHADEHPSWRWDRRKPTTPAMPVPSSSPDSLSLQRARHERHYSPRYR
jgi:hypothetical protein